MVRTRTLAFFAILAVVGTASRRADDVADAHRASDIGNRRPVPIQCAECVGATVRRVRSYSSVPLRSLAGLHHYHSNQLNGVIVSGTFVIRVAGQEAKELPSGIVFFRARTTRHTDACLPVRHVSSIFLAKNRWMAVQRRPGPKIGGAVPPMLSQRGRPNAGRRTVGALSALIETLRK